MNQKEIMRLLTKIHWKHQLQRDVAIRPIVSLNAWRNYCNALLVNPKFDHALRLAQTVILTRESESQSSKKNM